MNTFLSEFEAYRLLKEAGLRPPRFGLLDQDAPFESGEPIVLKGLGEELWHKSDLDCVRFLTFDPQALEGAAQAMRDRVEGEGLRWLGALVCERIRIRKAEGLPAEALASLVRVDGEWVALMGYGGLQAEALAELAPPLCWPLSMRSPAQALDAWKAHPLGRLWLAGLRGVDPLTREIQVLRFLEGLWNLAALAEEAGLSLLEMNPVALDDDGALRPLDALGRREPAPPTRLPPLPAFAQALLAPRSLALAGVSSQDGGVGRIILGNLRTCQIPGGIRLIKPGAGAGLGPTPARGSSRGDEERAEGAGGPPSYRYAQDNFLGLPAIPDVAALAQDPVDLLLLALPAPAAAAAIRQLIAQGGGATAVGIVAGGLGDGADTQGLGQALEAELQATRRQGRWTPALLGPNFLGHWVPRLRLDTSFIPTDRLAPPRMEGGPLAFLSQSGAFLLCRRSQQDLSMGFGVALGNQMDAGLPELLEALAEDPDLQAFAAYVEGFKEGGLAATARAAARLRALGKTLLIYRAGRTEAGRSAAATHTGAVAGEGRLETELLRQAGAHLAPSQVAFDAALGWLGAYPRLRPGPVALLTNAGFESVTAGDLLEAPFRPAELTEGERRRLADLLRSHNLEGLVTPRLPLDLTPMADAKAYLQAAELLLESEAAILVVSLVPFTRRLPSELGQVEVLGRALADLARASAKAVALAVDAGADHGPYREALGRGGLPVFTRVEKALMGLVALA